MPSEKISDEVLTELCFDAIAKGWTKDHLYHRLKAERKQIGVHRLRRIWLDCGGRILVRSY